MRLDHGRTWIADLRTGGEKTGELISTELSQLPVLAEKSHCVHRGIENCLVVPSLILHQLNRELVHLRRNHTLNLATQVRKNEPEKGLKAET